MEIAGGKRQEGRGGNSTAGFRFIEYRSTIRRLRPLRTAAVTSGWHFRTTIRNLRPALANSVNFTLAGQAAAGSHTHWEEPECSSLSSLLNDVRGSVRPRRAVGSDALGCGLSPVRTPAVSAIIRGRTVAAQSNSQQPWMVTSYRSERQSLFAWKACRKVFKPSSMKLAPAKAFRCRWLSFPERPRISSESAS